MLFSYLKKKIIIFFVCVFVCIFISGIFAYLNYLTPKTRREILELLVTGLKRLEYRGYDSAGVAIDSNDGHNMLLVKRSGKVLVLEEAIKQGILLYQSNYNSGCYTYHLPLILS